MDKTAIKIVREYIEAHLDKSDSKPQFEVYTVWKAKVLQNWKYLLSSTLYDGMYYEATYNGDKNEWYLDAYKKFENKTIPGTQEKLSMPEFSTGSKTEQVQAMDSYSYARGFADGRESMRNLFEQTEPQTDCGDFADRLAYERGVKHAWEVAQKVFDSTVTFYEAEDVAKQIDKMAIGKRSDATADKYNLYGKTATDEPQTERSE